MGTIRQTPPAPRFDHTAAVHAERYLLIFGGSSHSTCFNDLHILDLQAVSCPHFVGYIIRLSIIVSNFRDTQKHLSY